MVVKKEEGWIYNEQKITDYFLENFKDLYLSNHPSLSSDLDEVGDEVITEDENGRITQTPFEEEIKDAIWKVHPLKSRDQMDFRVFSFENIG